MQNHERHRKESGREVSASSGLSVFSAFLIVRTRAPAARPLRATWGAVGGASLEASWGLQTPPQTKYSSVVAGAPNKREAAVCEEEEDSSVHNAAPAGPRAPAAGLRATRYIRLPDKKTTTRQKETTRQARGLEQAS